MNIVVNALSARLGGGQTYLINLFKNMNDFKGDKIFILSPESLQIPHHPKIEKINLKWPTENPLFRALWEKYCLPGLLKKLNTDVLFCPGGLINTSVPDSCKTVTMFRNMIPFDMVQRAKYPYGLMRIRNWILERAMLKSMLKADLVIFISEFARQIIDERTGSKLKNIVTIPHGINSIFKISGKKEPTRPKWLPKEEYFLYTSFFDVYKNQLEVVRAYHLLKKRRKTKEKLVLVGNTKSEYAKKVIHEIYSLGLQNDVICPGEVNYLELPGVYYYAKLNIFASECENCPNILLEALGAGQPLLVSDKQPMPEFGGDAAVYFNASFPEDLADKISDIIDDSTILKQMSLKSIKRSNHYDWAKTAGQTWKEIAHLL